MKLQPRSNEFLRNVESFCRTNGILPAGQPVAVALSGGADSVALLATLVAMGHKPVALHCNFHLRGDESMRDEHFCRKLCSELGVTIEVRDFDVPTRIAATGESVEMACRELRYEWWHNIQHAVAVAHHADDNVETLLLNLIRGSGLNGLKGMLPKRDNIVRPFLGVTRTQILDFLQSIGLSYVTDSTNLQNDFRRNRLRNIVLPCLENAMPGATAGIMKSLECLRGDYALFSQTASQLAHAYTLPDGSFDIAAVQLNEKEPLQTVFRILSPEGFNMPQCREIVAAVTIGATGQRWTTHTGTFVLEHGTLRRLRLEDAPLTLSDLFQPPLHTTEISRKEFDEALRHPSPWRIFVDAEILSADQPIQIRQWREGDRLEPFGMKGSRLVSDIFSDARIGRATRTSHPLLFLGHKLLWVIGLRASRHYAVGPDTNRILSIEYRPQ